MMPPRLFRLFGRAARRVLCFAVFGFPLLAATDYHVATPEQFTARTGYASASETGALLSFATLRAGDRVLLKGGSWSGFRAVLTGAMTDEEAQANPARILACDENYRPTLGGVVVDGLARVNLKGAGLVLAGVRFSSRAGMFRAGSGVDYNDDDGLAHLIAFDSGSRFGALSHLQFDRCGWDNTDPDNDHYGPWVSVSGYRHTIQYCEVAGRDFDAVNPPATNRSIRNATFTFNADSVTPFGGHKVRRVYFGERKVPRGSDPRLYIPEDGASRSSLGNGWETLRIGNSSTQDQNLNVTVEECVFYHAIQAHDGGPTDTVGDSEIISGKSRGNVYRHNTFLNSYGQLTLRHGDYGSVYGNVFLAGGAYDSDGRIVLTEETNRAMGGVRSIGYGNLIANNYFHGLRGVGYSSALCLVQGDTATRSGGVLANGNDSSGYETANYNWIFGNTFIDCATLMLSYESGGPTPVHGTRFFNNLVACTASGVVSTGISVSDSDYTLAAHGGLAAGNWLHAPSSGQLGRAAQVLGAGNTIGAGAALDPRLADAYAGVLRTPAATSPIRGTAVVLPAVADTAATGPLFDLAGQVARAAAVDLRGVARGPAPTDPGAFGVDANVAGARPLARHEVGLAAAPYPAAAGPAGSPLISEQPRSASATVGDTVVLTVRASGASPLRYQWRKAGKLIPGATSSALILADIAAVDAGEYRVEVDDGLDSALSDAATVAVAPAGSPGWHSTRVVPDADGRLTYPTDGEGNRIVDFSHAGYRGGGVPLPQVPVVKAISPVAGDNTAAIQAAIDAVGALPLQPDGYRGALLLTAGVYAVSETIFVRHGGVVLMGVGDELDPATSTIIRRTGTSTAPVIVVGGGTDDGFRAEIAGTRSEITTAVVPLGARSFQVANPALYAVGQAVIVWQPSTEAWLASVNYGDTVDPTEAWKPGEIDLRYHRYITAIEGDTLTVDAPIFNRLERALSQSHVFRYDASGTVTHAAVDRLFVDIETNGEFSEDHADDAVRFVKTENCWARDVQTRHFVRSGIKFGGTTTRSTAERCRAVDPHSLVTGERRYNFCTYRAQLVLFRQCYARAARHAYISNGASLDSGVVFLDSVDDANLLSSEGHRRWPQALLYDNITTRNAGHPISIGLYNRTDKGTGHGWSAAHSVAWRADAGGETRKIIVQKPPGAQNHAIGCLGTITGEFGNAGSPAGFIEGANRTGLYPRSLYIAQVADRLNPPAGGAGASVFRDGFTDGERAARTPPDSLAWFCSSGASNLSVAGGAMTMTTNGGTAGRHAVAYFPRQTLAVGGKLTYRVAFRLGAPLNDFARGLRFGLFDSTGGDASPADTVLFTGDAQNPVVTYPGYAAMVNVNPTAAGPLEVRRRVPTPASALATATSSYPAALGGAGGTAQALAAGVDYVGTLVLERTAADALALSLSISGGSLVGHAIIRTDVAPVVAFDTAMVAIYSAAGVAGAGSLVLDEASLAHAGPAPAAAGFAAWRRVLFTDAELADESVSGPESDADGDGLALLAAYAFGAESGRVPAERRPELMLTGDAEERYLALSFTRRRASPDVVITAEAASALAGEWGTLDAARFGAPTDLGDGTELVLVRDSVPLATAAARFLRLRVSAR